ncbi:MAG: hypothetical protein SO360_01910 [Bifidobacterium tsurumiense]|uniref:hypothetical protein n=1 Tax=Bifidobacterium tsurumiense TaxID=356829 RepID=UPI002A80964A|nr:hypothetical protein [Bifidobacterium tsurumiense]MDY4677608.1 hypothetical protein [Bifidobacterium tsurumiense]
MNEVTLTKYLKEVRRVEDNGDVEYLMYPFDITVDEDLEYPSSIMVALAHLAASYKGKLPLNIDRALEFEELICEESNIQKIVEKFKSILDPKDFSEWNVWKYILTTPKPVDFQPPFSMCPRCSERVWTGDPANEEIFESYHRRENPLFCLNCGQRFKYDGGRLSYRGVADAETVKKLEKGSKDLQPTFAETDAE